MKRILASALSLTILTATFAEPPQGLRTWSLAHSFHSFVPPMLQEVAESAGIKGHEYGISAIGGARVITHWDASVRWDQVRAWMAAGKVDVLTLSPIWLPDPGIENFVNLALQSNLTVRITIQEFWLPHDEYVPAKWVNQTPFNRSATDLKKLRKDQDAYDRDIDTEIRRLNKLAGKPMIQAVPVGQAVLALREKIAAGQAFGVQTQEELFVDPLGHPTIPIQVLNTYCHYAVIYRRSPVGLPMPSALAKAKNPNWDENLNRLLQELAWEAVTHHPLSGVK